MSKEEIFKKEFLNLEGYSSKNWEDLKKFKVGNAIYNSMDEYAKQEAMAFFKWYGAKMMGFVEYITKIKPIVTSNEIELAMAEFEGQTFENLYNLFKLKQSKT